MKTIRLTGSICQKKKYDHMKHCIERVKSVNVPLKCVCIKVNREQNVNAFAITCNNPEYIDIDRGLIAGD